MKRLILFLLLLAAPLYAAEPFEIARTNPYVAGGNYAAAACTAAYGAELAVTANASDDGGGAEADATTGWTSTGLATFDSITTAPQAGTYHLTFVADSGGDNGYRAISGLSASTMYKYSMYVRHNGTASANGEWACYLGGSSALPDTTITPVLTTANNTYVQYVKYAYYNARQDVVICQERNAANDGGVYVDNFSITAVTTSCLGVELYTSANAASVASEANATTGFTSAGTATFESSDVQHDNGSYSIRMVANADAGRFYQDISGFMTAGHKYFISWKHLYKAGDGFMCLTAPISALINTTDVAENVVGTSADTSWVHAGFSFVYDANHAYFGCKENGANNNADFYIDTISIKEILSE